MYLRLPLAMLMMLLAGQGLADCPGEDMYPVRVILSADQETSAVVNYPFYLGPDTRARDQDQLWYVMTVCYVGTGDRQSGAVDEVGVRYYKEINGRLINAGVEFDLYPACHSFVSYREVSVAAKGSSDVGEGGYVDFCYKFDAIRWPAKASIGVH
jgi:hypothetical protein